MSALAVNYHELAVLSGANTYSFPPYQEQLLHLANVDLKSEKPTFAERMCELDREATNETNSHLVWENWYANHLHNSVDSISDRMMVQINLLQQALKQIDRDRIRRYVEQQLITDSYLGKRVIEAILMKVAEERGKSYDPSDDDNDAIDGYVGGKAVVVSPLNGHGDTPEDPDTVLGHIYYHRNEQGLDLEVEL